MKKSNLKMFLALLLSALLVMAEFSAVYAAPETEGEITDALPETEKQEETVKETTHPHEESTTHCVCGGNINWGDGTDGTTKRGTGVGVGTHDSCADAAWVGVTTWAEAKEALLAGKNIYLKNNIDTCGTGGATVTIHGNSVVGNTISICLNGYTVKQTAGTRWFNLNKQGLTLNICDCGQGGAMTYTGQGGTYFYNGAGFYLLGSSTGATATVLNIFGGEIGGFIGGCASSMTESDYGACIGLLYGSMNMYGGKITKNKMNSGSIKASNGETYYALGPAIGVAGPAPVIGLFGGEITGGFTDGTNNSTTSGGLMYIKGSTCKCYVDGTVIEGGQTTAQGGNINLADGAKLYVRSGAIRNGKAGTGGGNINIERTSTTEIIMEGGEISGGSLTSTADAYYYGGNIYVNMGKLTMSGGDIKDGRAINSGKQYGGNIGVGNGIVAISGGQVLDGISRGNGGNIFCSASTGNTNTNIQISGGTVSGGICASSEANAETGTYSAPGGNIASWGDGSMQISGGKILNGRATQGGNINHTGNVTITDGIIAGGKAPTAGNIFHSTKTLTIDGGEIIGGEATKEAGGNITAAGNFIMTGGIVANGKCPRGKTGANLNLTMADTLTATLTGGTVSGGNGEWGSNLYVPTKKSVTLDGTDFGTEVTLYDDSTAKGGTAGKGGNIYIPAGKTITVTEKTEIANGTADGVGGGNIYAEGNIILQSGATVKDGQATGTSGQGGNIYMINAKDKDGNFLATPKLTMTGANVQGGNAKKHGGNIYVETAEVAMTGGTVSNGTGGAYGGNFCYKLSTQRTHTISGVTFDNGKNTAGSSGNVCFWSVGPDLAFNASECIFKNGNATGAGGNFGMVDGYAATTTFTGCEFKDGTANKGGNVAIGTSETVIFDGCTFDGGSAVSGGNIGFTIDHSGVIATFKNGCVIKNGKATTNYGGNIYNEAAIVDLGDSEIKDGVARSNGGNIYTTADMTLEGAQITGGVSQAAYGGSIHVKGAKLTIEDDTLISGGKTLAGLLPDGSQISCAGAYGGNIALDYVEDATTKERTYAELYINGGVIENGETAVADYKVDDQDKILCAGTWAGASGGNIAVAGGCSLHMTGGIIRNGKAVNGGNIVGQGTDSHIEISGGQVLGGTATGVSYTHTGNGSTNKTLVETVEDSSKEAKATTITTGYGANIFFTASGTETFLISGGEFTEGTAPDDKDEQVCVVISSGTKGQITGGEFASVYSAEKENPVIEGGKFVEEPGTNLLGQSENEGKAFAVIELDTPETSDEGMTLQYTIDEVDAVFGIGEKKYASFRNAMDVVKTGDTVTLLADCEETEGATVKANVTVDIAGKNLTIPSLAVIGQIKDSGETKGSIIMGDPDDLVFNGDGDTDVLPVYEEGAFKLYNPAITDENDKIIWKTDKTATSHATKALYAFCPTGEDGNWEKVFGGSELSLQLSCEGTLDYKGTMTFVYGSDLTTPFKEAQGNGYFTLRINSGLSNADSLTAIPSFNAVNSNAVIKGAETEEVLKVDEE